MHNEDKFSCKNVYIEEENLRNKVDVITKGIQNDLPKPVIEKQLELFEFLNTDESFYTIKDGILYKVIPCK